MSECEIIPSWDLKDLYENQSLLQDDIESTTLKAQSFEGMFKGNIEKDLFAAIKSFEAIQETINKIGSYAYLSYSTSVDDPSMGKFYQDVSEKLTNISQYLVFFTLELSKIDLIKDDARLFPYYNWIKVIQSFRPHYLGLELEQLCLDKDISSKSAWIRLYDETLSRLRFALDDKILSLSEITHLLSHECSDVRQKAALAISKGLNEALPLFVSIMNALLKDKNTNDKWRKFKNPKEERHLYNDVEGDVVNAMVDACIQSYPKLSHRYYALKAKTLGQESLQYWDRNAPLPLDKPWVFSWEDAKTIILDAYDQFHPQMGHIAKQFFDKGWIDAKVSPAKMSGAFSCPTVASSHPYILMSYQGRVRDVMTLAHELGHGIHQILCADLGALLSDTPLTLAETASVFGEMLTFQSILKSTKNRHLRKYLLAAKIDDKLNTVIRQVAFHQFETLMHQKRKSSELLEQDFSEFWMETQKQALGPSVILDDLIRPYWAAISHFFHLPFYVYAYAFGDCLVNSLYFCYQQKQDGFSDLYLDLLSKGGSQNYVDLLKPFNLDPLSQNFWNQGLSFIESLIDEFDAE